MNKELRKIFGHKGKEEGEKWRKLHSEELYGFHFPPDIIRVIKEKRGWGCGTYGERCTLSLWWGNRGKETAC